MRSEAIETQATDTQREGTGSAPTSPLTITVKLDLSRSRRGRKGKGVASAQPIPGIETSAARPRCSPLSRSLSQALIFERMIRQGHMDDHADLSRIRGLSRGRISQLMNLLSLAPDIQEQILALPGDEVISEHGVRGVCREMDWEEQRRMWATIGRESAGTP